MDFLREDAWFLFRSVHPNQSDIYEPAMLIDLCEVMRMERISGRAWSKLHKPPKPFVTVVAVKYDKHVKTSRHPSKGCGQKCS